jgi:glutamine amidotransferase-like uncharacterized protein
MDGIRSNLVNFNYVGVCAGGFLGANQADLFITSHFLNKADKLEAPIFHDTYSNNEDPPTFNLVPDYKAVGSFYPNDNYQLCPTYSTYIPYRVNLSLTENGRDFSQLYVGGPLFSPIKNTGQSSIVATYIERKSYVFPYVSYVFPPGEKYKMITTYKTITNPAAIIAKPSSENTGAVLLSGTHIETCVRNSQLLTFFKTCGMHHAALKDQEYDAFVSEQEETRSCVESLLATNMLIRLVKIRL